MPGRKDTEVGTYLTPIATYREDVDAVDAGIPAELIDIRYQRPAIGHEANKVPSRLGYNSRIYLYILGGFTKFTATLYQDMASQLDIGENYKQVPATAPASPQWVEVQKLNSDGPETIVTDYLVPARYALKITSLTLAAPGNKLTIFEQHTE